MASSRVEFAVATPDVPAWKDSVQETPEPLPGVRGTRELPYRPRHLCSVTPNQKMTPIHSVTPNKNEQLAGYAGRGRIPR